MLDSLDTLTSLLSGCFYQTGTTTTSTGKVLSNYINTYSGNANAQCSTFCLGGGYTFFGTVNNGTTTADCYCGNTLNYVSASVVDTGQAPDNDCALCNYGYGECGVYASTTVAIFVRSF